MASAPLARLLRIDHDFRRQTVRAMLERHRTEAASYWTQLVLSTGIATFGLVLNSGAVIIGAMLVAPLMGPILELAMGLAVGSALLAIRSAIRVVLSVAGTVLSASVLIRLLPFHEVTSEVAARTSPTVLDLMVATFCALTAAYVTLKPHDTMTTAAGTSIGISLVPPLCASGFGVGIGAPHVAWGALLLFTANLSAILLFALLVFLLAGFGSVNAAELEAAVIGDAERKGPVIRTAALLNALFGSRHATAFKLLLPVALVGAVFVPLQRALSTVSSEVRARQQLAIILNEKAELKNALMTTIGFDQGMLAVRLVVVGDPERAKGLEGYLRERVASLIGNGAAVSVIGVPDAAAVTRLAAAAQPAPLQAPMAPPPTAPLAELQERVEGGLSAHYPAKEAGPLLAWSLAGSARPPELRLTHLGAPLGAAATKLLGEALAGPLHGPVSVLDDALSPELHTVSDQAALVAEVSLARPRIAASKDLRICVGAPLKPVSPKKPALKLLEPLRALLDLPESDVREAKDFTWRVSREPCSPVTEPKSPVPAP